MQNQDKNKAFDKERTEDLQKMHQSYGRGGVIVALVLSLLIIGSIVYGIYFK